MIHGLGYIILKSGSTTIEIRKVIRTKFERIAKSLRMESELDNKIYIDHKKDRLLLEFKYHIFKYGGNECLSKYRELLTFDKSTVKLKFSAGLYFKDTDGNEADFDLTMNEMSMDTPDLKDVMILTLESLKPIDFSASALPANTDFAHIGENYYPNVDSQGNIQVYNVQ